MSNQNPNSNIELSSMDQKWVLDILLNDKLITLYSSLVALWSAINIVLCRPFLRTSLVIFWDTIWVSAWAVLFDEGLTFADGVHDVDALSPVQANWLEDPEVLVGSNVRLG